MKPAAKKLSTNVRNERKQVAWLCPKGEKKHRSESLKYIHVISHLFNPYYSVFAGCLATTY